MKTVNISAHSPYKPPAFVRRYLRRFSAAGLVLVAAACTNVPTYSNRTDTYATDIQHASLASTTADELTRRNGGQSSFVPLFSGIDALGARLRLIERAEHTIDAQYFLIKPDHAGSLFKQALLDAADRGVRVRFLLDDVFTTSTDRQFAVLERHENIEIRLFNPLSRNSAKAVNFLFDFGRVNRRMHNKSLTIDGSMSIMGGRNIADEYFQINTDAEFADLDIFAVGPITDEISKSFDIFWNDKRAVSMRAFMDEYKAYYQDAPESQIDERAAIAEQTIYREAVDSTFLKNLRTGVITPVVGRSRIVSDIPTKLAVKPKNSPQFLADEIKQEMRNAKSNIVLITPYFVPREDDVEMFKEIRASGRRVQILTNSLAATNHSYVHGGYAPVRKELLRAGVELYEVRVDALQANGELPKDSEISLTMHTKAAIFDNRTIFIGSLNYDPRSIEINTEIGLFLDVPELARQFDSGIESFIAEYTYTLSLDSDGDIVWRATTPEGPEVETSEPGASFMRRLVAGVTAFLPVKGQL